jgi:peroxiredoxin
MRNLLHFIVFLVLLPSCKDVPRYTIQGTIIGASDEMVYLMKMVDGERVTVDSVNMVNGTFSFGGKQNVPQVYQIKVADQRGAIEVFMENSLITVFAELNNLRKAEVSGSAIHDEYAVYQTMLAEHNMKIQEAYRDYLAAREEGNEELAMEIEQTKVRLLQKAKISWQKDFLAANPNSFISPYILLKYLYFEMSLDEVDQALGALSQDVEQSPYYQILKENIAALRKVEVGMPYADITLPDTSGKDMSLSSFVGKGYVLIDFWAAWCSPCRRENPHLVKIYDDYREKGFEIFGVSFDKSRDKWLEAIHEDGIAWPQVSDLRFWQSSAAKLYGVRSIPHTVLIDPEGNILAKNLRHKELRAKLEDLLD